jgi:transcriptional regulator with XRE-family HTH domain
MKINEILITLSSKEKRQISQSEIAKVLGESRQAVNDLKKRNKDLSSDKVEILEKKYNIKFSDYEKQEAPDKDVEQVVELYIKFRSGDKKAGELLEEKINLIKKFLEMQE